MLDRGQRKGSWSGNARKGTWVTIRDRRGRLNRDGVRALIVARRPGNAGGAKERREVKAP